MAQSAYDYLVKVIIVGDPCVGKTSFLSRYIDKTFSPHHDITFGVEFTTQYINDKDGRRYKLHMWDTAGQERFRAIGRQYYRDATIVIVMYDTTTYKSYRNVQMWMNEVRGVNPHARCVLVGTKVDKVDTREVDMFEASDFASANHMPYFEVSSKTGVRTSDVIPELIEQLDADITSGAITSDMLEDLHIRRGSRVTLNGKPIQYGWVSCCT